jgi:hypothetical protein
MTSEQRQTLIKEIKARADNHEIVSVWEHVRSQYRETTKGVVESIAHEIKLDNKYSHNPDNGQHKIYLNHAYKPPSWSDNHPIADKFRTGAITALFSLLVGLTLWYIANKKQGTIDAEQNKKLKTLRDSITILQLRVNDTSGHR